MELGIKGKNVLVVGASKGIGRAIALAFAEEGCNVVALARSMQLLEELKKEALQKGAASFEYESVDIMECDAVAFAQMLIDKYGEFEIVIQNVGGSLVSRNHLADSSDWSHALRFNALASIDMNSVFLPIMIKKGWGRVIHISSISAQTLRGNPLYASSKAFLNAYVTTVGRQLASSGVLLTSVMPGAVAFKGSYWDNFTVTDPKRCEDYLGHHQAIGRFGTCEEIADVVLFMASERSSFMPAVNIGADGGSM